MDKEDVCSIQRERERDAASNEREEERASDQALPKPRRYYTCIRRLSNSNGWPMQIAACSRALYVLMGQWHRATSVQWTSPERCTFAVAAAPKSRLKARFTWKLPERKLCIRVGGIIRSARSKIPFRKEGRWTIEDVWIRINWNVFAWRGEILFIFYPTE